MHDELRDLICRDHSKPLVCLEVNPPRGTDVQPALDRLGNAEGIDLFNVTDCALAKLRLNAFAFGHILKTRFGKEPLVNLSCRDRNVIGLQSDLLGAWALGIRSVIALTGDAVTVGDMPEAKGVFEINSIGLLNMVAALNKGTDLANVELKGASGFVPGVVVNPNARNSDAELRRLVKKRDAGALYALSQPVFDPEQAKIFFEKAQAVGVRMLVGLMPIRSSQACVALSRVPGIRVPEPLCRELEGKDNEYVARRSLEVACAVAEASRPYVRGFHVVSGGAERKALSLVTMLRQLVDKGG